MRPATVRDCDDVAAVEEKNRPIVHFGLTARVGIRSNRLTFLRAVGKLQQFRRHPTAHSVTHQTSSISTHFTAEQMRHTMSVLSDRGLY